ncbi:hypothetical protein FAF44_18925 [Nonomuraea sp. MG754425]|uniref:hypothetical protein n=1 Tax=Nonomuraea sp. MG754425 TaxID=2570319 RepID=UPI001F2B469B|nr:hypothetical protein [Nonomuraea sp. MG754425]MCF6470452.1 hypothetical protein [Nonomuraea sp. MG754425]
MSYDGLYVLAGRGMDLSGELDCNAWECQKKQVDVLFSRTWHYFNKIVVTGLTPEKFQENLRDQYFRKVALESQLRLLLYLRKIGAEKHLMFRQKAPACQLHFEDHLQEAGLDHLKDAATQIVGELARTGKCRISKACEGHIHYSYDHSILEHTQWGVVRVEPGADPARCIAEDVFKLFSAHMVADVRTSKIIGAPLSLVVGLHRETFHRLTDADEHSVALELALPFLEGVPVGDILKIRDDEYLSFEKFRSALRSAIKEKVAAVGDRSSVDIADEIADDMILPALNEIALKLNKAQQLLTRKSALSVGVGVATTLIGALGGMPLLLPAGIASILLPSGAHAIKYLEEKRDVELSDMYFLWKLQGRADVR